MTSKARITYRFDPNRGPEEDKGNKDKPIDDAGRIIPLYREEYRVVEEQEEPRASGDGASPEHDTAYEGPGQQHGRGRKETPIRDYRELNQFTSDFGAWSSPFDAETQRIEELIRESNEREGRQPFDSEPEPPRMPYDRKPAEYGEREAHYSGQTGYYDTGRAFRDSREPGWEGPVVMGPRYVRHNRPPWLKISASIAGAAVTGVLLGFFALSLFSGGDSTDEAGKGLAADTPAAQEAQAVSANVQSADGSTAAASGSASVSGKETALAYAGKSYYFLQHGSFAAQQGAGLAKNDLVKKGLAAATEQSDKFYVFAGVAADKESASELGKQLKETNQVDIYVKAYQVPAVAKVRWNGSADTLKSYLEQSDQLLLSINKLTVLNLDGGAPGAIDSATLQSVAAAHTAWSQLSNNVLKEAGEETRTIVQQMNTAMNSAKASLDEYKKNPSAAMLWQSQTYMLQFIIAEKEFLGKIGA